MQYPEWMTAEDIRAYELEMNDRIDAENKALHAKLERDWELDAGEDFADGYDPEYDGQPDEAQEWHDFDPDC